MNLTTTHTNLAYQIKVGHDTESSSVNKSRVPGMGGGTYRAYLEGEGDNEPV